VSSKSAVDAAMECINRLVYALNFGALSTYHNLEMGYPTHMVNPRTITQEQRRVPMVSRSLRSWCPCLQSRQFAYLGVWFGTV